MDATNRQIIAQLAEIGREYFETLGVEPGTYTAAELETAQNSTAEETPPQAAPVVVLDVVEEPRTVPAMFRASPPALVRPSVVLVAVERSGPPDCAFGRPSIVRRRSRRRGSRAIRGDTANIFPNKFVNFVLQKYFNTS